jgi:hypothetical protein
MSVLTLAEAKAHLNIPDSDSDAELQTFIDAAEAALAARVGPLGPTTTTARVAGGRTLSLPVAPAVSITSVTPVGGTALTVGSLYLDKDAGVISYSYPSGLTFPYSWYDVVYVAGRAANACPDDLLMADKELLRHMWTTQRPSGGRFSSGSSDSAANTIPGAAYLFPFRVEALLDPYRTPIVF